MKLIAQQYIWIWTMGNHTARKLLNWTDVGVAANPKEFPSLLLLSLFCAYMSLSSSTTFSADWYKSSQLEKWVSESELFLETLSAYHFNTAILQKKYVRHFYELSPKILTSITFSIDYLLRSPCPPNRLCSVDCRGAFSPHLCCRLPVTSLHSSIAICLATCWQLSPVTTPPLPMLLLIMDHIIQHIQTLMCKAHMHQTSSQAVMVKFHELKCHLPWSKTEEGLLPHSPKIIIFASFFFT